MEGEWFHENMHVPESLMMLEVRNIKENILISFTIKPFGYDFNFFVIFYLLKQFFFARVHLSEMPEEKPFCDILTEEQCF